MADKIKIRRGDFVDLPNLDEAEFGLATDTGTLYIGTAEATNILVNPILEIDDGYSIDGYLIPAVDNVHNLGSPENRWGSVYVGPGTLNIIAKDTDAGFASGQEFRIGIDPDTNTLQFVSGDNTLLMVLDQDGGVNFPNGGSVSVDPGILATIDEHYIQHSDAIHSIVKDLDGYAVDSTVSEHYDQQNQINQLVLQALDAYGAGGTEQEHYAQQSQINQTIIQALDGYTPELTFQQTKAAQAQANQSILQALDGYAISGTEQEHYIQQSQINQTIIQSLDGYVLDSTFQDNKNAQNQINQTIIQSLDGYAVVPNTAAISDGYVTFFIDGGKQLAGDNDLYWDRVNNRLGIGTVGDGVTLPAAKLEVADNNPASGLILKVTQSDHNTYGIIIGNDTFSTTDTDGMAMYVDNSGVSVVELRGTGARYSVQVGGGEAIRILNNRNIGFGTATPQNKVDVEGAMVVGATYSGTNTAPANGMLIEGNVGIGITSVGATQVDVTQSTSSTTTSGIDISNDSTGDAFIRFGLGASRGYSLGIDNSDSDALKLGTNSDTGSGVDTNTIYTITAAGLFGLGTTVLPTQQFEIKQPTGASAYPIQVIHADSSIQTSLFQNEGRSAFGTRTDNEFGLMARDVVGITLRNFTAGLPPLVGIGTRFPVEALTVAGTLALQELAASEAPSTQDGYGKIYVRDDKTLHYKNGPGVDQMVLTTALPFNAAGADGYLAFYTDTTTLIGDNDLFWDRPNQRLLINTPTAIATAHRFQISNEDTGFGIQVIEHAAASYAFSGTEYRRARGELGARTTVATGDTIGSLRFRGYNGSGYNDAALIEVIADTAVSGGGVNDMPGRLAFHTTPDGSATLTERMRISNNGRVTIGGDAIIVGEGAKLQVLNNSSGSIGDVIIEHVGTSSNDHLHFRRARGGSFVRATVAADDPVGVMHFLGYDGTGYIASARIEAAVDGTPGTNDMPGRLTFHTTPDNASAVVERMRISNDGRVGISTTSPQAMLHVAGDGYYDGYLMPFTDNVHWLGTPDKRWQSLYLGPSSLHIRSAPAETTIERDWSIGISQAEGATLGNLLISQDEIPRIQIQPTDGYVGINGNPAVAGGIGPSRLQVFTSNAGESIISARDMVNAVGLEVISTGTAQIFIRGGGGDNLNFSSNSSGTPAITIDSTNVVQLPGFVAYASVTTLTDTTANDNTVNPFRDAYHAAFVQDTNWRHNVPPNNITYTTTTGQFQVGISGVYAIEVVAYITSASTGIMDSLAIRLNGATNIWQAQPTVHSSVDPAPMSIILYQYMDATNYVELTMDGALATTVIVENGTTFNIRRIG